MSDSLSETLPAAGVPLQMEALKILDPTKPDSSGQLSGHFTYTDLAGEPCADRIFFPQVLICEVRNLYQTTRSG